MNLASSIDAVTQKITKGEAFDITHLGGVDNNASDKEAAESLRTLIATIENRHLNEKNDFNKLNDERNLRLEGIINTMVDALIVISDKGMIQSLNQATTKIFGYAASELIGQNINILMPEPYHSEHDGYLRKYRETGKKSVIGVGREVTAKRKDATTFAAHLSVSEVQLGTERIFTGIIRDISEQKKAEQDVKARNEALEAINWTKTHISEVAEIANGADTIQEMTKAVLTYFGAQFHIGHGTFYIRDIDTRGNLSDEFYLAGGYAFSSRKHLGSKIVLEEGLLGQAAYEKSQILLTDVPADYISIQSSLGEAKPLNLIAQPIIAEGDVIGMVELASFKPLTKKFCELLDQISESLALVINRMMTKDRTDKLLKESQELAQKLKEQQAELEQSNEELLQKTRILEESEQTLKQQQEELRVSNEELEEKSEKLAEEKKKTEEKAIEIENAKKEIEIKAKELSESSKYKSEFLANMSHELRTPLNSLLLLSGQLKENEEGNLTDEQVKMLNCINSGGEDLLYLISDILDLSKVEAGMLELSYSDVNVEDVLQGVIEKVMPQAKLKKLDLSCESDQVVLNTDPFRLEQILKNLLSNAIKFTDKGCVKLRGRLAGDRLEISVEDTGIGIPQDKLETIFEAFKQVDGSTSRKYGGTGLGLSITRNLVNLLDGRIHVTSEEGKGSVFKVIFHVKGNAQKIERIPHSMSAQSHSRSPLKSNKATSRKVAILDDDIDVIDQISGYANTVGYQSVAFNDCQKTIQYCELNRVAAIFVSSKFEVEFNAAPKKLNDIPVHVLGHNEEDPSSNIKVVNNYESAFKFIERTLTRELKKVLVVEDDPASLRSVKESLEKTPVDIKDVGTGILAIEALTTSDFDCIILDFKLPDMNAIELLKKVYADSFLNLPPVIINTSRDLTADELRVLNHYTNTIVIKGPYSKNRLVREVEGFLTASNVDCIKNTDKTMKNNDPIDNDLEGMHILIADDDFRNTLALSTVLKKYNLKISIADNGQIVFDKLRENRDIRLIIMDVMMPVKDGYQTIKELRSIPEYKNMPIIALSASTMNEVKAKCIEVGANDFMSKPVNLDNLLPVLKMWLKNDRRVQGS